MDIRVLLTCLSKRCLSWQSPPVPGSRRRTWVCQAGATGNQSLSSPCRLRSTRTGNTTNQQHHFAISISKHLETKRDAIFLIQNPELDERTPALIPAGGKGGLQEPLTCSDPVLERSLVEDVGGEGAEGGVHAVLHLQPDGPDAQHHQPLKQGLGQPSLGSLLAHHHRPQLAVVTHQDQLWGEFGDSSVWLLELV